MAKLPAMNDDTPPQKELPLTAPKRRAKKQVAAKSGTTSTEVALIAKRSTGRRVLFWTGRIIAGIGAFYMGLILLYSVVPPPINLYQIGEAWRLGGIEKDWVSIDDMTPTLPRSAVAAEDANFCLHWGFDMKAIREAVSEGSNRGASTISQQTVKNVFLWHGRSWLRKAMEAAMTPVVELFWSKSRILEVYLNVAEFGTGVFGVQAAAQHYFGVDARDLTPTQAARLAAVLPDPQNRNAAKPSNFVRRRTAAIMVGAETIAADGRAACFEE